MNLNKITYIISFLLFLINSAIADNHDQDLNKNTNAAVDNVKTQSITQQATESKAASIEEDLNNVPLNNPFGGGVSTGGGSEASVQNSSGANSIAVLQGKKLVGIIKGNRKRFALFQSANGSIQMIGESDFLTRELFVREISDEIVLVEDSEKKVFEVAFNNLIRPMEGN